MDTDDLIAAQIAYYRARAPDYDGELERVAEHDLRPDFLERWEADIAELDAWLAVDPPRGHVLELAAGSGNRTGPLLRGADRVTAVDAPSEMLALLEGKHTGVETIVADIFSWQPAQRYDNVFFGFWMSHIPAARWRSFWDLVDGALRPGGKRRSVTTPTPNMPTPAVRGIGQKLPASVRSTAPVPKFATARSTMARNGRW